MNKFRILVSTLILSILLNSSVSADHLKGKSKAEKDGYLKARVVDIPAGFKKIQISPATTVKTLKREIIENNVTGWLVEPRNSKVLADKIIEVFSLDPKRKDLIVRNAQKKIREKFNLPNMLNQTLGIYEELIERKKNFNN